MDMENDWNIEKLVIAFWRQLEGVPLEICYEYKCN